MPKTSGSDGRAPMRILHVICAAIAKSTQLHGYNSRPSKQIRQRYRPLNRAERGKLRLNRNSGQICPRLRPHRGRASFANGQNFREVGLHQCPSERRGEGVLVRSPARPFSRPRPPADRRQSAGLFAYSLRVHC
jgi:hypothetical protein